MGKLIVQHSNPGTALNPFPIYLDGKRIGETVPGGAVSFEVENGTHTLAVGQGNNFTAAGAVGGLLGMLIARGIAKKQAITVNINDIYAALVSCQINGSRLSIADPVTLDPAYAADYVAARQNEAAAAIENVMAVNDKRTRIFGSLFMLFLLAAAALFYFGIDKTPDEPVSYASVRKSGEEKSGEYVTLQIDGYQSFLGLIHSDGLEADYEYYCYVIAAGSDDLYLVHLTDKDLVSLDLSFDRGESPTLTGCLHKLSEKPWEGKTVRDWALEGALEIGLPVTDANFTDILGDSYMNVNQAPTSDLTIFGILALAIGITFGAAALGKKIANKRLKKQLIRL